MELLTINPFIVMQKLYLSIKNQWIILFVLLFSGFSANSQFTGTIPLDTLTWERVTCGDWEESGDSIVFYGTSYRVGGRLQTVDFFDFSNAEVYVKWKVSGNGDYAAYNVLAGGSGLGKENTTDHSFNGSVVIQENQWYYTYARFNPDTTITVYRSTGDFYLDGGTLLDSTHIQVDPKRWELIVKDGKLMVSMGDNYAGVNASMTLGYVAVKNAEKLSASYTKTKSYDFEDGLIPDSITVDNSGKWTIADQGYESNKSIYAELTSSDDVSFSMNVSNASMVSFDLRFVSGYTTNPVMYATLDLDSTNILTFDPSGVGCWRHFEWIIPDTLSHELRWYSKYLNYYQEGSSQVWIDNITVYYASTTGIEGIEPGISGYQFTQNYPNPFRTSTTFKYVVPKTSFVSIEVYDVLGRLVDRLENSHKAPGTYELVWQPDHLKQGTYFCRMKAGDQLLVRKVTLLD
jgi:hypothetical protein